VSVKHRIGVDDLDRYDDMVHFVSTVAQTGCRHFTVHARKAWLQGLSPKDNRTVPPLRYGEVHRLKQEFPHLWIEINGGFADLEQIAQQLDRVDGVMIGRAAYDHPYLFAAVDQRFWGVSSAAPSRQQVVEAMLPYIDHWVGQGLKLNKITRHLLMLFTGQPGSRLWKQILTEEACRAGAGVAVVQKALAAVQQQGELQQRLERATQLLRPLVGALVICLPVINVAYLRQLYAGRTDSTALHFAAATPYETVFSRVPASGEQVLAPEVARLARQVLSEVVEHGTATRPRTVIIV